MTVQTHGTEHRVVCPECKGFTVLVKGELKGSLEAMCVHNSCRAQFEVRIESDGTQKVSLIRGRKSQLQK